jgi:RpiB/LacA/LacB family sugar-phosphate isomerase
MRLAVAADHAGFPHKAPLVAALRGDGHEVLDLGTWSTEPVDYPDAARAVGEAVSGGGAELGILVCGSGAGVAIAANKLAGVRAALCHDLFTARQAREDDNANVLCLGARVIGVDLALALARAFIAARFSRAERHVRRLAKVEALEATFGAPRGSALARPPVGQALAALERRDAGRRLWARDPGLWTDDAATAEAIRRRLGWLAAPAAMRGRLGEVRAVADRARGDGVADVVLLGMGGSSLAPEVLAATFGPVAGAPPLTVLDTTDPGAIRAARARLKPSRSLVVVASKSGTTVEVQSLYAYFRGEVAREVARPGEHFIAITDAGTPLDRLATADGFRHVFRNDPDIGGRFSALSYFGLVPAALCGIDPRPLVDAALSMAAQCRTFEPLRDNPGARLGAILAGLAGAGRDKVTFLVSDGLRALGAWIEQLLTESTGKRGRGLIVVDGEPPGPPEVHGADRLFVSLALGDDPALAARAQALEAAGHPVVSLALGGPADLGAEFFRWEVATALAGALLGLNPFDEPNVAQAKAATADALTTFRTMGRLPAPAPHALGDLVQTLAAACPGDYVALLAYLTPTPEVETALQALRALVRDRTRLATTLGYGPRYLHSTGQLHKGGPDTVIPVLFTRGAPPAAAAADAPDHLPIPGADHDFATLQHAQAVGDFVTLTAAGRRALWLPLDGEPAVALEGLRGDLARHLS